MVATFAAATVLFSQDARASDPMDRNTGYPTLRILPWTAPVQQKALIELLKERDHREGLQGLGPSNNSAGGLGLLEGASRLGSDAPVAYHKPMLGTFKVPFTPGRMSLVSEKIDANGRIAGVDFLRVEIPNWDIGVKGTGFRISHKWGKTGGERPFANTEKKKVKLPE
jgi:hypothetical protein